MLGEFGRERMEQAQLAVYAGHTGDANVCAAYDPQHGFFRPDGRGAYEPWPVRVPARAWGRNEPKE